MNDFCHLHVHDQYSVLDGFGSCFSYVSKAKELNQNHLALTNHGNIDGIIKFQKCCIDNNIKHIIGCELYIVPDLSIKEEKEKRGHVVVLVKNHVGWNNLTKMLSIANTLGFYKKPRVDYNLLTNHHEGLIISTACASSFIYNNDGYNFLDILFQNKADVCFEIMPIDYEGQKNHNKNILELKSKYKNANVIATNDCHYPNQDDVKAQEVLLAIQTKVKWNDPKRWKFSSTDLYLKSREEMEVSFAKNHKYIDKKIIEESLNNTVKIAEKCNFTLEKSKIYLPQIFDNEYETLKRLAYDGLYNKIISNHIDSSQYRKRLNYELEILEKLGFVKYFLIIYDIILWCKKNDIFVGFCRGSVGGSLIAFLIDITNIDPIKHNLMFERFISPDRIKLPDIDIDFEDSRRKEVRKYIEQKYGEFNTASVSTFLQMKSKMVFKDVCRVFDIPLNEVNAVSKNIDDFKEQKYFNDQQVDNLISDIKKIFDTIPECIKFKKKYPEIIKLCLKLEGQIRGIGKHAAAIIVTEEDLRNSDRCSIINRDNGISINWDKRDAEYVGMLKIDILGLSNLSIIHYIKDLVKANHNVDLNFNNINLDDKNVLNEFAKGNCNGIFQFGSWGLKKLCIDLRVDSFKLLTHITSIYRPAFLRSGMIDTFKHRRFNEQNNIGSKTLYNLLKDTYGMLIYQEQVITIMNKLAGFSFTESDLIRKFLDEENKEILREKYRYNFIQGCINNGIKRTEAINIWNEIIQYGGYSFNKSHAVGYTVLSYVNMFCKFYYPIEFYCASLTYTSDKEKKEELMKEAISKKINIITPKIGISDSFKWISKNNNIYMPFIEIKGIGEKYAETISTLKSTQSGFFNENKEIKGKLKTILDKIDAFNNYETYSKNEYISFNIF